MKKLNIPDIDDVSALETTAANSRLRRTSYPLLALHLPLIKRQYQSYVNSNADAWKLKSELTAIALKEGLVKNYNSLPSSLKHIDQLRASSPDVCPMCGSMKTSTLDHFFPKEDYPEWTVFSKNLVPACDCNINKGRILKGSSLNGERLLHPYFDTCMQSRQVSCTFSSSDNYRVVDISIDVIDLDNPLLSSVEFHIEKIVKPSGIVRWLQSEWLKMRRNPYNVVHTIPQCLLHNELELEGYLRDALSRYDYSYGTKNNWHSIFVHGLLNSNGVLDWLFNRHNNIVSGQIDLQDE